MTRWMKDMKEMKKKWDGMSDDEKTMAKEAMKGKLKEMAEKEKGGKLDKDEEKEFDAACEEMNKDFDGAMKKMKKGKKKMKGKKGGKKGGDKKLVLKEKEMEAGFEKMMKGDDEPDEKDMKEMKKKWDGMSDDEKTMAKEAMKGKMKVMAEEEKGDPLTQDEEKEFDAAC